MGKIGVFLAEGMEEIEALTVVDICRRAGIELSMVSITNSKAVTGSHGIKVEADEVLSEIDFDTLSMIVLPGGMPGTLNLAACPELMKQVDAFATNGKYVAAICAAPSILGERGLLKGKNACCYPGFEEKLLGASVLVNPVEVADKVITSRGMGTAIEFALSIVSCMKDADYAEELRKAIIYKC